MVGTHQVIVGHPQVATQVGQADHHTHQVELKINVFLVIREKMERTYSRI